MRTPDEQAKDARRRRWGRAVARALTLGGLCGVTAGWLGLLLGLVAAPLSFVEDWGARRDRPKTAALVAWAVAVVWLTGAHLQVTFVSAMYEAGPRRGDLGAAFEAVRLEVVHVSRVSAATDDDLRGAVFVIGALILSLPSAFRLDRWWGAAAVGPVAASTVLILPARGIVFFFYLGAILWMWIPALLLVLLNQVTDGAVDRVMDRGSHVDGAPDG